MLLLAALATKADLAQTFAFAIIADYAFSSVVVTNLFEMLVRVALFSFAKLALGSMIAHARVVSVRVRFADSTNAFILKTRIGRFDVAIAADNALRTLALIAEMTIHAFSRHTRLGLAVVDRQIAKFAREASSARAFNMRAVRISEQTSGAIFA